MAAAADLHVFCDFDGTIAVPDTLVLLTERVGGGVAQVETTERLMRDGKIGLEEAIARDAATIRVSFAEAVPLLRQHVTIDAVFPAFARWCAAEEIPLTILSGGFEEIIELFLPACDFPGIEVRANRLEPGSWRCVFRNGLPAGDGKAHAVREARALGCFTIFVGDGISDLHAAAAADEVFARRGRPLAAHCRSHGIPFHPYDDFSGVWPRVRERR